jgi:hypothetical protein
VKPSSIESSLSQMGAVDQSSPKRAAASNARLGAIDQEHSCSVSVLYSPRTGSTKSPAAQASVVESAETP